MSIILTESEEFAQIGIPRSSKLFHCKSHRILMGRSRCGAKYLHLFSSISALSMLNNGNWLQLWNWIIMAEINYLKTIYTSKYKKMTVVCVRVCVLYLAIEIKGDKRVGTDWCEAMLGAMKRCILSCAWASS